MAGRNARNYIALAVVVFAMVSGVALVVLTMRTPAPPPVPIAPKFPKPPEAHPVLPPSEEPVAPRPPQAFCEARDIGMIGNKRKITRMGKTLIERRADPNRLAEVSA